MSIRNTIVDSPVKAGLVLTHGRIWTVDCEKPQAEAVAVWNGSILAVGSTQEMAALVGPETEVLDLAGKLVLPGFSDSHTHFVYGGFHLLGVDLRDAASEKAFGELLAAKSKELPEGAWITGGMWDHEKWPGANYPTKDLIDAYVPDRPVLVDRYDGHMSVANSLALRMAGITAGTPDPVGGIILRHPDTGEPAGGLQDTAYKLVREIIPPPSRAQVRLAIETGLALARQHGFTCIHQVDLAPLHLEIYQELLEEAKLTARIYGFVPIDSASNLVDLGIQRDFHHKHWIAIGGVKAFMDGSLGSTTALFFEPYVQDPSTAGIYLVDPQALTAQILAADKAGLQLAVHAIGDRAIHELLDMFEALIAENGPRDRRIRLEHAQHMPVNGFERFAELEIIASVQPYHAIDDARFAEKRIGLERCETTYAFKSFLDSGVTMAFGSDWTVAPLDAIWGIYAAVTRRPLDGSYAEGWFPEQRIPVEEAIAAYTQNPAYACFQEDLLGSITPGKLADMVVLSQDIRDIPLEAIKDTEIVYTITHGQIVYRSSNP